MIHDLAFTRGPMRYWAIARGLARGIRGTATLSAVGKARGGPAGGAVLIAAVMLVAGCGVIGGPSTQVQLSGTNASGVGHVDDGASTLLVGTSPMCVTGGPARLTNVEWDHGEGVNITGFAVVNQRAGQDRIGTDRGELSTVGLSEEDHEVTSSCSDAPEGEPATISYLVLELTSRDSARVTNGEGLVVHWVDSKDTAGEVTDDFSVIWCPRGTQACDEDSVPSPE